MQRTKKKEESSKKTLSIEALEKAIRATTELVKQKKIAPSVALEIAERARKVCRLSRMEQNSLLKAGLKPSRRWQKPLP